MTLTESHARQPGLVDLAGVVDAVRRLGPGLEGDLGQPHGVRGVGRADHDHQVGTLADLLDRELAVLGGVADVVAGRVEQLREALPDRVDGRHRLVDRQRGLGEPGHLGRVAHDDAGHVGGALHELDVLGGLAGGALDLLVALVADQQDVVVVAGEAARLVVHLGHQRAGRVDRLQRALGRLLVHHRRDAVGREHDRLPLGHLVELLDEDRAAGLEVRHDVLVVHDLLAHVDRRAVEVEGLLDRDHRAVDAGAVAARRGEAHGAVGLVGREDARRTQINHGPIVGGPVRRRP